MTMQFEKKQFKQIQTHSQSGRSMVEMLGVLAIIAILSIGGIVMFRYAMNYYQANQIAHEMNIMRTDAQIKIAQGTEKLMLGEPYDPISESTLGHIQFNDAYPIDFACALADEDTIELSNISCHVANAYYIELQNIPEGVCLPLAELVNGMNNIIAFDVNKNEYPETGKCEAGNGNVLNAVFSAEAVSELKVCAEDTDCESENALYCDPSRHVCVRCYEDNQCEHNQYCENNTCVTCESGVWNGEECVECTNNDDCTDSDTPVCYTDTNTCVECLTYNDCTDTPETPQCDEISHTCKSCAEIDPNKPLWYNNTCVECVTYEDCKDTPDTPNCNTGTNTCESCPQNSFWDGKKCQEGCRENSHCAEDEYCHKLGGFSCTDEWEDAEDFSGSCRKVNDDLIFGTVDGQTYYGSSNTMNWWSVKRFCEAAAQLGHGNGQMAVWGNPDFKCNPPVTLTSSTSQYCHKNGTDVHVGDFNDLSTTVEELREMFGVTHTGEWDAKAIDIWLNNQDSCQLFEIEFSTPANAEHKASYIMYNGGASHLQYGNHALCQP